jgi:hypothetical protein
MAVPQLGQNLVPGVTSSPHDGQWTGCGPKGWPQLAQKRAPTGLWASQLAQLMVGGAIEVPQEAQNLALGALAA